MPGALDELIPHRAPMQWLDALADCTPATATATVRFEKDHFAVADGKVLETALVECVAQTAAAATTQRLRAAGGKAAPGSGMLAAVSGFKVHSYPPLGESLSVEIRELKRFGPMLLIAGSISCGGKVIASGEFSLYA